MPDFKDLDVRINAAGVSLDNVSKTLGTFLASSGVTLTAAGPLINAMIAHSADLQSLQAWSTAAQVVVPKPVLPNGMVVVDVGADQGTYTGPVNAATLTIGNLAFIDRNLGGFSSKWGQVFNAKPVFPSQMGVLANTQPDPGTPDGFDLRTFIGKPDVNPA